MGADCGHYQHNLDVRIALCRTYASGELVLPENATAGDVRDLQKMNDLFEMHRKTQNRFNEFLGEFM